MDNHFNQDGLPLIHYHTTTCHLNLLRCQHLCLSLSRLLPLFLIQSLCIKSWANGQTQVNSIALFLSRRRRNISCSGSIEEKRVERTGKGCTNCT
ncbi:hypothetical protein L1887_31795 [Cichorium endivia]|nr:hypothetical protein L1887_31795 [Cichorium endivia]